MQFVWRALPGDQDRDGLPDGGELTYGGLRFVFDRFNGHDIVVALHDPDSRDSGSASPGSRVFLWVRLTASPDDGEFVNTRKYPIPVEVETRIGTLEVPSEQQNPNWGTGHALGDRKVILDFDYNRTGVFVVPPLGFTGDIRVTARVAGHSSNIGSYDLHVTDEQPATSAPQ